MKTALKFISLSVCGLFFASCCGIDNNFSCGSKITKKTVTTYKEEVQTVDPGGKGGMPYTTIVKVPVTETVSVKEKAVCTDEYCPRPDPCGTLSNEVISRATVQGGTGEPMLGLIPTMKSLVKAE
jgi:hypothetical protein